MSSYIFRLVYFAIFFQRLFFAIAGPLSSRDSTEFPTHTVYQFPNGTWVENIAVRSNGDLLVTVIGSADLYLINPSSSSPTPQLVYRFPNLNATFGIAELSSDKFALIAGNDSFVTGSQNGSYSIWTVDFGNASSSSDSTLSTPPKVSKSVDLVEARILDGMSALTEDTVLVEDIDAGIIYGVNVNIGSYYVASTDPLIAPAPNPVFGPVGVNGIHARDNVLYFVTSGSNILGRFPIDKDGKQIGNSSIIAHAFNSSVGYDDFAIDKHGYFFLATGPANSIEKVTPDGKGRIIAGSLNSTAIAEPTSCAFGRGEHDQHVLYVTTGGALAAPVNGDIIVGGQVVAVDLRRQ